MRMMFAPQSRDAARGRTRAGERRRAREPETAAQSFARWRPVRTRVVFIASVLEMWTSRTIENGPGTAVVRGSISSTLRNYEKGQAPLIKFR